MKNLIASSADAKQLSLTVKGLMFTLIPVAGLILKSTGQEIDEQVLRDTIGMVGDAVIAVGAALSALAMVVGSVRRILASFKK